jgi:hypothetical protein
MKAIQHNQLSVIREMCSVGWKLPIEKWGRWMIGLAASSHRSEVLHHPNGLFDLDIHLFTYGHTALHMTCIHGKLEQLPFSSGPAQTSMQQIRSALALWPMPCTEGPASTHS